MPDTFTPEDIARMVGYAVTAIRATNPDFTRDELTSMGWLGVTERYEAWLGGHVKTPTTDLIHYIRDLVKWERSHVRGQSRKVVHLEDGTTKREWGRVEVASDPRAGRLSSWGDSESMAYSPEEMLGLNRLFMKRKTYKRSWKDYPAVQGTVALKSPNFDRTDAWISLPLATEPPEQLDVLRMNALKSLPRYLRSDLPQMVSAGQARIRGMSHEDDLVAGFSTQKDALELLQELREAA